MLKSVLREQNYIEDTKYPKEFPLALIWAGLTILITVVAFAFLFLIKSAHYHPILDFLNEINNTMKSYRIVSVIFFGLMILSIVVFAFIIRNKSNSKKKKVILRTILIILIVLMIIFFMLSIAVGFDEDERNHYSPFLSVFDTLLYISMDAGIVGVVLLLTTLDLMYLITKLIIYLIFTQSKESRVTLKILKGKGLPICYNSEAFRVSQIAMIYIIPIIFIYSILFILLMSSGINFLYMLLFFFYTIIMTFDLTALIYALFCKIKYKIEYIAFDHHMYETNVFKKIK